MRTATDAIQVSVWFAWSCALLFVAGYSVRARWWRRLEGRAFAAHGFGFILLVSPFVAHYALGVNTSHLWFAWYYAASFTLAGLIELWRLWVVWRR